MQLKLFPVLLLLSSMALAVSSNEVNQNLTDLMTKINNVNQELQKKHDQHKNLEGAINDSNAALDQSGKILSQLKQQRNFSESHLNEIKRRLPEVQQSTKQVEDNVKTAMTTIYTQLKLLQNNADSLMSVNNTLESKRKIQYLTDLLKAEALKYQDLQTKLDALSLANASLVTELNVLDQRLADTAKQQQQLQLARQKEMRESQVLDSKIAEDQQQLAELKRNRADLNRLLSTLAANEAAAKAAKVATNGNSGVKSGTADNSTEENSPFFNRTLAKPLNAPITSQFGTLRKGLRSNGVLYTASHTPVYAISTGTVMYNGELPGFGQVIVIDHGDNYVSVSAGCTGAKVSRGQNVKVGQQIADAGTSKNQPMGGVYFELRHFGRPVNPSDLVNH